MTTDLLKRAGLVIDRIHSLPFSDTGTMTVADKQQRRHVLHQAYAEQDALRNDAEALFGQLNGWTKAKRKYTASSIGKVQYNWDYRTGKWRWDDHRICYRAPRPGSRAGINVAIVGQPYGKIEDHRKELDECADLYGLKWHIPPNPLASIWYPGATLFIVMTIPGIEVKWLPEQIAIDE